MNPNKNLDVEGKKGREKLSCSEMTSSAKESLENEIPGVRSQQGGERMVLSSPSGTDTIINPTFFSASLNRRKTSLLIKSEKEITVDSLQEKHRSFNLSRRRPLHEKNRQVETFGRNFPKIGDFIAVTPREHKDGANNFTRDISRTPQPLDELEDKLSSRSPGKRKNSGASQEFNASQRCNLSANVLGIPRIDPTCSEHGRETKEGSRRGVVLMDVSSFDSPGTSASSKLTPEKHSGVSVTSRVESVTLEDQVPTLTLGNFQESVWLDFGDASRNVVGREKRLPFLVRAPHSLEHVNHAKLSHEDLSYSLEVERVPYKKGFSLIVDNSQATCSENDGPIVITLRRGETRKLLVSWTPTEAGGVREVVHFKLPRGRLRVTVYGSACSIPTCKKSKVENKRKTSLTRSSVSGPKNLNDNAFRTPSNVATSLTSLGEIENFPTQLKTRLSKRSLNGYPNAPPSTGSGNLTDKMFKISAAVTTSNGESKSRNPQIQKNASEHSALCKRSKLSRLMVGNNPVASPSARKAKKSVAMGSNCSSLATMPLKTSSLTVNDSEWAKKQCESFTKWMNYTFRPTEDEAQENETQHTQNGSFEVDGGIIKSIDRAVLRTLLLHRRRAEGRKRAMQIYNEDRMLSLRRSVEGAVEDGRLVVREDRDMYADLGLRNQVVTLLLSYSTPWLHLGLETVFGEIIPTYCSAPQPSSKLLLAKENFSTKLASKRPIDVKAAKKPTGTTRAILKKFIIDRVLGDPVTLKKFTRGRCKVPSGAFERRYHDGLRKNTLRRILLLVAVLDECKRQNVLDTSPRLFIKEGKVKSSRDILTLFCRDYLSGEGNIIKHLSQLGLNVCYAQTPLDEYNFTVSNLALDMRDGLRLTRLVEILTKDTSLSLSAKMRLPAVSRLQKLHNVGVAISALEKAGISNILDVNVKVVVDGHSDKVLKLLWSIIFHFQLSLLLDKKMLKEEINEVHRANKSRRRYLHLFCERSMTVQIKSFGEEDCLPNGNEIIALLLTWCQAVCSCFDIPVENFTTSFADGKVLCYLIHYYHPTILKREEIFPTTRDLVTNVIEDQYLEKRNQQFKPGATGEQYSEALKNERRNSALSNSRMAELGGIPGMLSVSDTTSVPEEKSMILCAAYLCSRLMESSKDILATLRIQACYRAYRKGVLAKKRRQAALLIMKYCHRVLDSNRSYRTALVLFLAARRKLSLEKLESDAATEIQRIWRSFSPKQKLCDSRFAATVIQSAWRAFIAYSSLLVACASATTIQSAMRGILEVSMYSKARIGFALFQGAIRGVIVRNTMEGRNLAANEIQRILRGYFVKLQCLLELQCAVKLQSVVRMKAAVDAFGKQKVAAVLFQRQYRMWSISVAAQDRAVTLLQRVWRGHLFQFRHRENIAALSIQRNVRSLSFRRRFNYIRTCTVLLQALTRKALASRSYIEKKQSIIFAQRICRGGIERSKLRLRHSASSKIQCFWRFTIASAHYMDTVRTVTTIQAFFRRCMVCKRYSKYRSATICLQSVVRGMLLRSRMQLYHFAATEIQRIWRCCLIRSNYIRILWKVVMVQSRVRRWSDKSEYNKQKQAAKLIQRLWKVAKEQKAINAVTVLESIWRRHAALSQFHQAKVSVVLIQRNLRLILPRQKLKESKMNAVLLQAWARNMVASSLYRQQKNSTISIQRIFRGGSVRARILLQRHSARRIQSLCRMGCAWRFFLAKKRASIAIQASFRCLVVTSRFLNARRATVVLQRVSRGFVSRRTLERLHIAATEVQRTWRTFYTERQYISALKGVIKTQLHIRSWLSELNFQIEKKAVLQIQKQFRAFKRKAAEREVIAVIRLQSLWRSHAAICRMRREKASALLIKTYIFCMISRRRFERIRGCILLLQAWTRGSMESRMHHQRRQSIVLMQRVYRGSTLRGKVHMAQQVAIKIQSLWRATRKRCYYIYVVESIILVQAAIRRMIVLSQYSKLRKMAIAMQSVIRGTLLRDNLHLGHLAATDLQRVWRRFHTQSYYALALNCIVKSQARVRMRFSELNYETQKRALKMLQRQWRLWKTNATERKNMSIIVLQRVWRRYVAIDELRRAKTAVVPIQRSLKVLISRRRVEEMQRLSILLQAWTRGLVCSRRYKQKRCSTVTIQQMWRGSIIRHHLFAEKCSATKIQRIWRGEGVRFEFAKTISAAMAIQTLFRRFLNHSHYLKARNGVIALQAEARGFLIRGSFVLYNFAATKIQQRWRGFSAHMSYMLAVHSAIKLQAQLRTWRMMLNYEKEKDCVKLIQTQYRIRLMYVAKKEANAATALQCLWRRHLPSSQFRQGKVSTVLIQRNVRCMLSRKHFEELHRSALRLQAWARKQSASRHFLQQRISVVMLQRFCRGGRARGWILRAHIAATHLQSLWRRSSSRCHYKGKIEAVTVLQAAFRGRTSFSLYRCARRGIIVLQAVLRGLQIRANLELEHFASAVIQRLWRSSSVRSQYVVTILGVIQIQARVRMVLERSLHGAKKKSARLIQKTYHTWKTHIIAINAAIALQRRWRIFSARCRRYREMNSVLLMQQNVRCMLCQMHFAKIRERIVLVQAWARKELASCEHRKNRMSAISIQRMSRGRIARVHLRWEHGASTVIQCLWRVAYSRSSYKMAVSVIAIQAGLRRKLVLSQYARFRRGTIVFQGLVRGTQARENIFLLQMAASEIQTAWRRFTCHSHYNHCVHLIIKLQSKQRSWKFLKNFRYKKNAVTSMQRQYRSFKTNSVEKETAANDLQRMWRCYAAICSLNQAKAAAVSMQRNFRAMFGRHNFESYRNNVVLLQAWTRSKMVSKVYLRRRTVTITCQSIYRGVVVRRKVHVKNNAAIKIQSLWRGRFAVNFYQHAVTAVVCIQSCVRGRLMRCYLHSKDKATIQIQTIWRALNIRVKYMSLVLSATKSQTHIRSWIARKKFEHFRRCIVKLQGLVRGFETRFELEVINYAACEVQRVWRGWRFHMSYCTRKQACIVLQSAARGMAARIETAVLHYAASEIQRCWRGYKQEYDYIVLIISAIQIQAWLRGAIVRRFYHLSNMSASKIQAVVRGAAARKRYDSFRYESILTRLKLRARFNSAKTIQGIVRMHLHRQKIRKNILTAQCTVRAFLARTQLRRSKTLALWLQSTFMGQKVRRQCSQRVRLLASRIKRANERAIARPEMKLGNQTNAGLNILQTSSRLAELIRAMSSLEVATRLSEVCCTAFAQTNAAQIIFSLIRTCNRSLPHMELLHYVLETLNNVAKHPSLTLRVATDDSTKVLIDLLQMFRDKEDIFCLATQLLYRFCKTSEDVIAECSSRENAKRLKGVYSLCVRKSSLNTTSTRHRYAMDSTGRQGGSGRYSMKIGMKTLERLLRMASSSSS